MGLKRTLPIINIRGLHARASRKVAELALSYDDTTIMVRREGEEADARSLMDLMMLGAGIGSEIEVEAEGPAAEAALDALEELVAAKFHEDE
ncbi:HPr family phosphocarrier protein [Vitreimonas sp.]|jgi:phosphocarrier protein HPr|uniref:HPr family phosphocarrier protein n=1 Tax=Vitreimonas sp. TaxID=3069702 RepID=UPI002EDB34C4